MTGDELLEMWIARRASLISLSIESQDPVQYAGFLLYLGQGNRVRDPLQWAHDVAVEIHKNQDDRDNLPYWDSVRFALREALDNRGQGE